MNETGNVSPLLDALYRGQTDEVEALLAADPDLDLFEAAALGRTGRLRGLLDNDPALANAWSSDGFAPLHLASFFGHREAVELLLDRGAALETVSRHAQIKVTPLQSAVASEGAADPRVVETLLSHGASPDAKGEDGGTALHSAAMNGDATIARLLLASGADPQAQRNDGATALELARRSGDQEVERLLA